MNNEIKEILNNIKRQNKWKDIDYFKTPLSTEDADKLLDYIINIQKENEDYKSRVEKAVEYYKMHQQECVIDRNRDGKLIKDYYLPAQHSKVLLNILQNERNNRR